LCTTNCGTDFFADLSYGADLGPGNDKAVIAIIRKVVPSELVPAVRVEVAAGAGKDEVTLAIDRAIEDFSAFLDGGAGRDFDHVTENVRAKGQIVNFEKEEVLPYVE
jgi:DsbC/DsbD-like thiol-disulfide interchange protein